MTEKERLVNIALFALVFCHIRSLAWKGKFQQAGDLADAFHNIPNTVNSGNCSIEFLQLKLEPYLEKYRSELNNEGLKFDYVKFVEGLFR